MKGNPKQITRRQVFRYGAGTAIAASAPILPFGTGRVEFEFHPSRVTVWLDGWAAWVTDAGDFTGRPCLRFTKSAVHARFSLESAVFPGSNVPANFVADCWRRRGRWQLRLLSELGGAFPAVDLASWLGGDATLGTTTRRSRRYRLAKTGALSIPTGTTLEWRPDWMHSWFGHELLEIAHGGFRGRGHRITATLARTRASSTRGWLQSVAWDLNECDVESCNRSNAFRVGGRRLKLAEAEHCDLSVETGRTAGGLGSVFTLHSRSSTTCAAAFLKGHAAGRRVPIGIPLESLRLVRTSFSESTSTRVEAHPGRAWVDVDDASFYVGGSSSTLVAEHGTNLANAQACHGDLHRIALSVPGFDSALLEVHDTAVNPARPDLDTLVDLRKPCVIRLDDYTLHVERMADQLALDFEFVNMALVRDAGTWRFDGLDPTMDSLLRVIFPPQHLQERAYFWQQNSEQVPMDLNDPKWQQCPPLAVNCHTPQDAVKAWREKLDPDVKQSAAANEYIIGRDIAETKARFSGPSRLVFTVPKRDSATRKRALPANPTASWLLGWDALDPRLSARAAVPDVHDTASTKAYSDAVLAPLAAPDANESSIEFPTDLFLSADRRGHWQHAIEARAGKDAFRDLWHTQLLGSGVRALWSTGFDATCLPTLSGQPAAAHLPDHDPDPNKRMSMDRRDRQEIVTLTSVFGLKALAGTANVVSKPDSLPMRRCDSGASGTGTHPVFVPQPVTVAHLSLSALGATARLKGNWDPPSDGDRAICWDALTVEEWQHIASLGRDVYVRMVYKGYLLPIGIRACLVKVTERKFVRDIDPQFGDGRVKCVLMQRMFIIIGKPIKPFPALGEPDGGRDWPFDQVEFTTITTPDIIDPFEAANYNLDPDIKQFSGAVFWPRVSPDQPVDFHYDVVKDATRTSLISALLFVDNTTVHDPQKLAVVLEYYDCKLPITAVVAGQVTTAKRSVLVGGSRLAYAPSRKPGDTQFETSIFEMLVRRRGGGTGAGGATNDDLVITAALEAESQPPFYPAIDTAHIRVEAIRRLSGLAVDEITVRFDRGYLRDGFSSSTNSGEIFLLLTEGHIKLDVAGNSSRSGAVATPNTLVIGLSRKIGIVGGDAIIGGGPPFECNSGGARALRVLPSGAADSGEVPNPSLDAIRSGGFDVFAYFAATLGDAKLLGIVRLADLVKAATKVIDLDSAPALLEHYEYQLSPDIIGGLKQGLIDPDTGVLTKLRAALVEVGNQVGDSAAIARLLQQLDVVIRGVDQLSAGDPHLIDSCTALVLAARAFLTAIDNVSRDPSSLLPSALQDLLGTLKAVLSAISSGDLTKIVNVVGAIDFAQQPYATIATALDPVRAPFQAAYNQALAIRNDLQAQINAGISQLVDALFPILGGVFLQYCRLIDEGRCFNEAVTEIKNHDVTALNDAFQKLLTLPAAAIDDLDAALASVDNFIRTQITGSGLTQYGPDFQRIASGVYQEAETLRGRLVALRDQLATVTKTASTQINDYLVGLSAQVQIVATVRAIEAIVKPAWIAAKAAPPQPAGTRDLAADLQALGSSLTTICISCNDSYSLLHTNSPLGTQLDGLDSELGNLFTAAGAALATVKSRADAARNGLLSTIVAQVRAAKDSGAIQLYLQGRQTYVWAAGLLVTAKSCFGNGQCPVFDVFPQLQTRLSPLLVTIGKNIVDALGALVTLLQTDVAPGRQSLLGSNLKKAVADLGSAIQAYNNLNATETWTGRAAALQLVMTQARSVVDTVHTAIEHGSIGSLVNVSALAQAALASLPLPTHLTLTYDWHTPLGAWPSDSPTFQPIDLPTGASAQTPGTPAENATLTIQARTVIDLLSGEPPRTIVKGSISPFRVYLLNRDALFFFSVDIQTLTFESSPGTAAKYTVKVGTVQLGNAFEFVSALEGLFGGQDEGDGFYSLISVAPPAIEVGYRFGFDVLFFGEFAIENLRLALGFRLPFDNTPALLTFQVSTKELPCLIVATPYGGGFFFAMAARAGGGIESLEGAFEFGAMTVFQFGPLSGSGRVAAGFYFSSGPDGATICGYVIASGGATIAWFSLSVTLLVSVCSVNGSVSGHADFEVTFRVSSFFKVSFSFTAAYSFAGGTGSRTAKVAFVHAAATLAHSTGAAISDRCPPLPHQTPVRCPKNVTRAVLQKRFKERKSYLADQPTAGMVS
jgi:hypothetical protein